MSERTERRKEKKKEVVQVYPLNKIIDSITYIFESLQTCSDDTNRGELMQDGKGG